MASEKKATRAAYGATLAALYEEGLPVVAVDADLACSTTTAKFAASSEEASKRLFNVGIAEQNMIGVAAGLSLAGQIAFTGSFAVFGTGRVYDQIRNTVCYPELNVKIAPSHAGISVGPDGGSHQMIEDIALMRVLPHMRILVPADYNACVSALRTAATTQGPMYVRMGRSAVPSLYDEGVSMNLGGSHTLREGKDLTFVACGVMVYECMQAAELLAQEGIEAEVIDAYSIKPLDEANILASLKKTGCVVTAEEHSIIGGLGSAIAELIAGHNACPLERVGMRDEFGTSGEFAELMAHFELDAPALVRAAHKALARK